MHEAGKVHNPIYSAIVPDYSLAAGAEGTEKLLQLEKPPTAIFAIADTLALGSMRAIKRKGLRIPQDIALISFNDIPAADLVEPALTTIATPSIRLGYEAMKMLNKLISSKKPAKARITLPVELIIRQSCGEHKNDSC